MGTIVWLNFLQTSQETPTAYFRKKSLWCLLKLTGRNRGLAQKLVVSVGWPVLASLQIKVTAGIRKKIWLQISEI